MDPTRQKNSSYNGELVNVQVKEVIMDEEKTTREIIDDEVVDEIRLLKKMDFGSQEYARAVDGIERLQRLNLDDSKIDTDWNVKDRELELKEKELKLKEDELEHEKKRSKLEFIKGIGLGVIGLCIPAALHVWGLKKSFEFEETGTISSSTSRNAINSQQNYIRRNL